MKAYRALFFAVLAAFRDLRVQALLLICTLLALVQASLFMIIEHWGFLDAFYFSVVSMATVGYGDLAPQTALGKVCAIGFLLLGIGVFVLTVGSIAQAILRQLDLADEREGNRNGRDQG